MLMRFSRLNSWLGEHMFLFVLAALLIGFTLSKGSSQALNTLVMLLFAYMTFVTALGTNARDFIGVVNRPVVPLWSLFLIHVAAPLLAWGIGFVFYPADFSMRLGFMISASIPIGVTSVMWTSIAGGDVALALIVVTADTLIVPVWLPVFLKLFAAQAVHIDFWRMLFQLVLMVTIPSIAGMALNEISKGRLTAFSRSFGGVTAKLALLTVMVINSSEVGPDIHWNTSLLKMLAVILLIVVCGFYLGYLGSFIFKQRRYDTVSAMVYNVGIRNISFGSVLAITYFSPAVAIPITLAMLYQSPMAAAVSHLLCRQRDKGNISTY